jgi:YjjI family glycine radical enzyme
VRLNLKEVVQQAKCSLDDILNKVIPENAQLQLEIINSRSRFLVEEIGWFKHNAFVAEGLLAPDQFTAYAGVYGLAEAVDIIMTRQGRPDAHYGHDREANEVAHLLIKHMAQSIQAIPAEYCTGSQNRAVFHAQVGISADKDVTPAARIPAGKEPDLYNHISSEAPVHKWITGGVSTILEFDQTASENPEAILDIIRGAFRTGARNLSIGSKASEFIRVTGYLMRRSDIEAAKAEKALRYDSSLFGVEVFENRPLALQRRVREV